MKVETITANKQQIQFRNFPQQQQSRNLMQSLVHVVSALTQNYLVLRTKLGNKELYKGIWVRIGTNHFKRAVNGGE